MYFNNMATETNYSTLIHGSFDTVSELWDDELNQSQVYLYANGWTSMSYTYLAQMPSYYVSGQDDEADSGVFSTLDSKVYYALDIILGNNDDGYNSYFEDVAKISFNVVDNSSNADNVGALTFGGTLPTGSASGAVAAGQLGNSEWDGS